MFSALEAKDPVTADHYRKLMEQVRQEQVCEKVIPKNLEKLPHFVKVHLNKNHEELEIRERSNCINAAFNFHDKNHTYSTYSTMDLLKRLLLEFTQVNSKQDLQFGDLVVLWSRLANSTINSPIQVVDLQPEAPGFPFGLVFDHVAVYLGDNQLFHKPDPTPSSRYQINDWDGVILLNEALPGFELTFHRKTGIIPAQS